MSDGGWDRVAIRKTLFDCFSLEELETLADDLDIDHDNLGSKTKEGKAHDLVSALRHQRRIPELVAWVKKNRSDIDTSHWARDTPSAALPGRRKRVPLIPLGVFVIVITGCVVVGCIVFWPTIKLWFIERQALSLEDARRIANLNLKPGNTVCDVVPFRNLNSDRDYIAALWSTPGSSYWTVHLLDGNRSVNTFPDAPIERPVTDDFKDELWEPVESRHGADGANERKLRGCPNSNTKALYGVLDIDRDGNHEVYSVARTGTEAQYQVEISVYDTVTGSINTLRASGDAIRPAYIEGPVISPPPSKDSIEKWLDKKAEELNRFNDREPRSAGAIRDWLASAGVGAIQSRSAKEYEGNIPELKNVIRCEIDDGPDIWRSFQKDAVYAFHKQRQTFSVVYVPPTSLDFATKMVSGQRYLWLNVRTKDGLLAYDKQTQTLQPVRLENVGDLVELNATARRYVDLQLRNHTLFDGDVRLNLPLRIDTEQEFANARICP